MTTIYAILAVILLISSVILFLFVLPNFIDIITSNGEEDEKSDQEKNFDDLLRNVMESIGRVFTILFFICSIAGGVISLILIGTLAFAFVGDIRNIRSGEVKRTLRSSYITGSINLLMIILLVLLNYQVFEDDNTRSVFNMIILFWFGLLLIPLSNIIINKTCYERNISDDLDN